MAGLNFQQRQIQSQVQIMSQKQIQSLEILTLPSTDLQEFIYDELEKNPALTIKNDEINLERRSKNHDSLIKTKSGTSKSAEELSESFQSLLEAQPDTRKSLHEHLLEQLNILNIDSSMKALGEKLIYNLDDKGFHTLAPISFIENIPKESILLENTIKIIQELDPVGTCTNNFEESLFIQAKISKKASPLCLYILNGKLKLLDPPKPEKIQKKLNTLIKEEIQFFEDKKDELKKINTSLEEIENALSFIKTLDPYPARNFSTNQTQYIVPEIQIKELPSYYETDNLNKGIVSSENKSWIIQDTNTNLPILMINQDFEKIINSKDTISKEDKKNISDNIKKAQDIINSIEFRKSTIHKACFHIVKKQIDFFEKGPGHLKPLKQADIAELLNVHETTISRMANNKYLQCKWGIFEIKYFFSVAIPQKTSDQEEKSISRDFILHKMREILQKNQSEKSLSDQKLSDLLAEEGIQIARRTVAKYRGLLNIESSYNR